MPTAQISVKSFHPPLNVISPFSRKLSGIQDPEIRGLHDQILIHYLRFFDFKLNQSISGLVIVYHIGDSFEPFSGFKTYLFLRFKQT